VLDCYLNINGSDNNACVYTDRMQYYANHTDRDAIYPTKQTDGTNKQKYSGRFYEICLKLTLRESIFIDCIPLRGLNKYMVLVSTQLWFIMYLK
jgi:hypothetical protein